VDGPLRVALVAHDACKQDMLEWALWNADFLSRLEIWATRSTGELIAEATGLPVQLVLSGPLGGDAEIAAMIARGELDMVVFLWDPLATHAHAADVQSLIRLAVVHNVAIACNRRSADLMMSSRLLDASAV